MRYWARLAVVTGLLAVTAGAAHASLLWNWSYTGAGIGASGTFATADTADAQGFYAINQITGQRNGVAITGLAPAGVPVPGNAPFGIDNLVASAGPFLTASGIGFSMADGSYVNLYYADFLSTPAPVEFRSVAPFVNGSPGPEDSELSVSFRASLANRPVDEPAALALAAAALLALRLVRRRPTSEA